MNTSDDQIRNGTDSVDNASSIDDIEALKKEISELKEQLSEFENGWKRALADYQNLKKRVEEDRAEIILHANENLMEKLIHVLAHLENLEKYVKDEGFTLILNEFRFILENEGLKELNPENAMFNPDIMEAIQPAPGEKNKVVEVMQKGYMINEKLIRPARVKVGTGEETPAKETEETPNR
ncbi:nucleotide exchange factor GrpE [Patescibacteria group bacterium]|nr:nucleotide exchange factor GrpE [Patescibacteria group bacterium]